MKGRYWQIDYIRVRLRDSCQLQRKWRARGCGNIWKLGIDDRGRSMAYIELLDR